MSSSKYTQKAKNRAAASKEKLSTNFPHVQRKLDELKLELKDLRRHSAKIISGAILAGGLVLGAPTLERTFTGVHRTNQIRPLESTEAVLKNALHLITPTHEKDVSQVIHDVLGMSVTAELDGHRLNASIGRIGGEQHLPRYPGDTLSGHDELQAKGITTGTGAFGYFAQSKDTLTSEAQLREKYYVAVQTMYLPNWNSNYKDLKEWYKFRKVLVVNPSNGRSIVAVIGDAGPAAWTGKQFGGSPEVMDHLQPYANKNNGTVLLYFIEENNHEVALGPVHDSLSKYIALQ